MGSKKRLFIGLLSFCTLALGGLALFLVFSLFHIEQPAYQWVLRCLSMLAVSFIVLLGIGILSIVISIMTDKPMGGFGRVLFRRTLALYPIALAAGRMIGISTSKIQGSFVEVNNRLVHSFQFSVPADKIVVLAPHCLQRSECGARVTQDANKCTGCGACDIRDILTICHKLGVHLVVVTGGTLARQTVRHLRPQAIVAIACERDLSSGIMDVLPLPALGVGNTRPEGPCKNTRVEPSAVEEAIRFFLAKESSMIF